MSDHARFSPSGAHRWMACPASLLMEMPYPNTSSPYAREGTAAHWVASESLDRDVDAGAFEGKIVDVEGHGIEVTPDMVGHVQTYLNAVRDMTAAIDGELLVEQKVDFSEQLDSEGQTGTADAIILGETEIQIHDLKYGMGVKVQAEANEQLMLYALGAINEFDICGGTKTVRMVIHQPRLNHISEWAIPVEELFEFGYKAHAAADRSLEVINAGKAQSSDYNPGEDQCRFCKHKANCSGLTQMVTSIVTDDFVDLDKDIQPKVATAITRVQNSDVNHLANCLSAVDLIESWCSAVRAQAQSNLEIGVPVPGFKLVMGKKGNRKWTDELNAGAALLKHLSEDAIFKKELQTPTAIEKIAKAGQLSDEAWQQVQPFITQSEGRPTVAPESDKREAVQTVAFDDLSRKAA